MEIDPRQKLCEIITRYGHSICYEPKKIEELLQVDCSQQIREVNVLLIALKQEIPDDFLSRSTVPYELAVHRLVKRLYNHVGIAEEFARWAVDSWALALGVIQTTPKPEHLFNARFSKADEQLTSTEASPNVGQRFEFETVTVDSYGKIIHKVHQQAYQTVIDLDHEIHLEMVYIPGGTFLMGSPNGEGDDSEKPQHLVTIKPFYMSKYPITQAQYQIVMGDNPAHFKGDHRPVEMVFWKDAVEFCKRLSQCTGKTYQLPSESQWEYACRAGTTTPFHFGETLTTDLANYDGNYTYANESEGKYRKETTPVGLFPPNAFGLYDIHGNVWEWCLDMWHNSYVGPPTDGSAWLIKKYGLRVLRGGSWDSEPNWVRSADRAGAGTASRDSGSGFRIVGLW